MNEKKSHISAAPRFVEMPVMWKTLTSLPHYFANPSGFTHSNKTFYKRNKCGTFNRNFNCRYPGKIIVVGHWGEDCMVNEINNVGFSPNVLQVLENFFAALRADDKIDEQSISRLEKLFQKGCIPKAEEINSTLFNPPKDGER